MPSITSIFINESIQFWICFVLVKKIDYWPSSSSNCIFIWETTVFCILYSIGNVLQSICLLSIASLVRNGKSGTSATFRLSCGRIFHKNSKVWANFKNISCFRMLTATPAKLFRGTTSLWILQCDFIKKFLLKKKQKWLFFVIKSLSTWWHEQEKRLII